MTPTASKYKQILTYCCLAGDKKEQASLVRLTACLNLYFLKMKGYQCEIAENNQKENMPPFYGF